MSSNKASRGVGCASTSDRTRIIYTLAQRIDGITSSECIAIRPELFNVGNTNTTLSWMSRSGRLERRKVNEGKVRSRFFAKPGVPIEQIESALSAQLQLRRMAYRRSEDAARERPCVGVRIRKNIKPIDVYDVIHAGPKITILKGAKYDERYQVDPNLRIAGGFSDLGIGRYLEDSI